MSQSRKSTYNNVVLFVLVFKKVKSFSFYSKKKRVTFMSLHPTLTSRKKTLTSSTINTEVGSVQ